MLPTVLSIAGSDPTGGAGLQADLKTMTSVGVYGAAVVTCVTVQNSRGVARVECLSPELVRRQVEAVLDDHRVTHVKIGMVGNIPVAEAICDALADFKGEIIYDPVILASTGHPLLEGSGRELPGRLLALATVLTPNLPELARLTGGEIINPRNALYKAERLFATYGRLRAVLVKGGHAVREGTVADTLIWKTDETLRTITVSRAAVTTGNTHGTGCTLAAAFAAFHCTCGDYCLSFRQSVDYVQTVLKKSAAARIVRNPGGRGGLLHFTFRAGERDS
jgi:hydroxymethylpyrimidine/phosphomethylpyrimidine kinase